MHTLKLFPGRYVGHIVFSFKGVANVHNFAFWALIKFKLPSVGPRTERINVLLEGNAIISVSFLIIHQSFVQTYRPYLMSSCTNSRPKKWMELTGHRLLIDHTFRNRSRTVD